MIRDPYLPQTAQIIQRRTETKNIFTLGLKFIDEQFHRNYHFHPGQFNMLYLYGVGEVAISVASDPEEKEIYFHTIRRVGQVTTGLWQLREGDYVGVRGPYGAGWPLSQAKAQDVVIITGGLGCAPSVSAIHYIVKRRTQYGKLFILQGVKHSDDLLFRQQYDYWSQLPNTQILLAASSGKTPRSWLRGYVTQCIPDLPLDVDKTMVMMCGPEAMMLAAIQPLMQKGLMEEKIYINMERNMECALGHCGHCQFGGQFVCKDGPVFAYPVIKNLFGRKGF